MSRLDLTGKDKKTIEKMLRSGKTEQRMALRTLIVLLSAEGLTQKQVAARIPPPLRL